MTLPLFPEKTETQKKYDFSIIKTLTLCDKVQLEFLSKYNAPDASFSLSVIHDTELMNFYATPLYDGKILTDNFLVEGDQERFMFSIA